MDDVGVTRVRVVRAAVAGEPAWLEVPVGDATRIAGARPDVDLRGPVVDHGEGDLGVLFDVELADADVEAGVEALGSILRARSASSVVMESAADTRPSLAAKMALTSLPNTT